MTILAIDDDPVQLERIKLYCSSIEYPEIRLISAENAVKAAKLIEDELIDLVLTDLRLPDGSGLELLRKAKALDPHIPVVVMTASRDAREAIDSLKSGADDYLLKPTGKDEIERLILRIHEKNELPGEASLADQVESKPGSIHDPSIMYRSEAMSRVMEVAARSAASEATVLITGESGTGKELVARFIHSRSGRRGGPFIAVNVSALPESLAEAELFGHRKGSFTGAVENRLGRFEEANGGTLFLDEVGDIAPALQVKLLRAIQFGEIERIGENSTRRLSVRIVAATNRDLAALVAAGKFREDLYYRLNVIGLLVPPLRVRKEDIPPLVDLFIARYNEKNGRSLKGLSKEAMARLMRYSFPGNVRELENIIERSVVLSRGDRVLERDLPALIRGEAPQAEEPADIESGTFDDVMREYEKRLIKRALEKAEGNQSKAARDLGIGERKLRSRMERLGMRR